MKLKKMVIDMDGTICTEKPTFEKSMAVLIPGAKEALAKWHSEGIHITIYTARGWGEYAMTKKWLTDNDVKHDLLMCGKPIYDVWIDDRALKFEAWDSIKDQLKG